MAFEDFQLSHPVISATDYDAIKIKAGEGATTDNFNRSTVDSINRDHALEAALTYMARSSSLFTTDNTKFLSHCEGQGIDLVSSHAPVLTTSHKDVFLTDPTFIGAAWPQRATTNMMSYGSSDSSLKSLSGWTVTNPSNIGATIISTEDEYTEISTTKKADDIIPGTVVLESRPTPLTGAGEATMNKVSGGFTMTTTYNMVTTDTEVEYRFMLLNNANAVISTHNNSVIRGNYNGIIGVENITIPSGATKFKIQILIKFKNEDSRASFTLKNVMVQAGGILAPYTQTTRQQCTVQYNGVVDPTLKEGAFSAMCWSTYKSYTLATHSGPLGPLFIRMGNITLGGVHRAKDGMNLVLAAYMHANNSSNSTYGNEITVPAEYIDQYLFSVLRLRPHETKSNKYIFEFAIVAGPNIYKSTLEIDRSIVTEGDLVLGTDMRSADFFNGPVSEVRYDTEWINDTELYIISLAKKAFSFKKSNDLGAADDGETVLQQLDKVGVNMLLNPTGRLAFVGWNSYPERFFTVSHNDVYAGNCFQWVGNVPNEVDEYDITSDEVPISPSTLYTIRAVMYSDSTSSGEAGIGIIWYDSAKGEISRSKVNMTHINTPKYYSVSSVSPSNAVTAKAFMYTMRGLRTTKLTWSRIKLERGDATQFTDDAGAGFALYY